MHLNLAFVEFVLLAIASVKFTDQAPVEKRVSFVTLILFLKNEEKKRSLQLLKEFDSPPPQKKKKKS